VVARQARDDSSIGQYDRRPVSVTVDFAREKERGVALDRRQLLVLYCQTEIVGRPTASQRVGVPCQIFLLRPDELRSY
jgi:hypothetical protein